MPPNGEPNRVIPTNFGPDDLQDRTNVSRETLDQLAAYENILKKWNRRINLVSRDSLSDVWLRHFLDSAQLAELIPTNSQSLVDFGSGGGFPGLVLAIMKPNLSVHLIDSDQRKCVFLREAARVCAVSVTVHNNRIEQVVPFEADVISARVLAPLAELLRYSARFARAGTRCLFSKGQDVEKELTQTSKYWRMRTELHVSQSNPLARIVALDWPNDGEP